MSKKKKIVLAVSISSIVVLLVGGAIIYLLWFFPTEIEVKDNHWEENESHIILKKKSALLGYGSELYGIVQRLRTK